MVSLYYPLLQKWTPRPRKARACVRGHPSAFRRRGAAELSDGAPTASKFGGFTMVKPRCVGALCYASRNNPRLPHTVPATVLGRAGGTVGRCVPGPSPTAGMSSPRVRELSPCDELGHENHTRRCDTGSGKPPSDNGPRRRARPRLSAFRGRRFAPSAAKKMQKPEIFSGD